MQAEEMTDSMPDRKADNETGSAKQKIRRHRRDNDSITWGIFLIFAGFILLLNTIGSLPWQIWDELWKFWPLLIVLGGINIVLGKNPLSRLIMLVLTISIIGLAFLIAIDRTDSGITNRLPENIQNGVHYWESLLHL